MQTDVLLVSNASVHGYYSCHELGGVAVVLCGAPPCFSACACPRMPEVVILLHLAPLLIAIGLVHGGESA